MMPMIASSSTDFRGALREVGLTQSAFARTLIAWGDPRPFDTVLRWVQRAAAGSELGPHEAVLLGILRRNVSDRRDKRRLLRLLESGNMRTGQNVGRGWEDTTEWSINETKRQIAELDKLLAECRLQDSMPTLPLKQLDAAALRRFQRIYVIPADDPDSAYLVWDSHRLLAFDIENSDGNFIEDAMVNVGSLEAYDLSPVYDRIKAAGGERGMVLAV